MPRTPRRYTAMVSFRVLPEMKENLKALTKKEKRTVAEKLRDYLDELLS